MHLTLDHVPFAWHDLDEITAEFDRLGLTPDYGGVHDKGVTHMAVLGFDDQSYVEQAEGTSRDRIYRPVSGTFDRIEGE
ncbi:VOC family protein [Halorussus salinisoli]|uniref:VOC family protein n=1 Tax=Halorussus salinisoli TaxID=2558242 RepID=UPI0010C1D468|nr:VOC family protein [Halorussus salinisoli]